MIIINSNDTIGNRTRDRPACRTVAQPTVPRVTKNEGGKSHIGIKIYYLIYDKFRLNIYAPRFLYIGQAFRYSPENAFYIFNQQIYFII